MFGALIKLRELARLQRGARHAEILDLVRDPEISEHRKAKEARSLARRQLMAEAERLEGEGRSELALELARSLLRDGPDPAARTLHERLSEAVAARRAKDGEQAATLDDARRHIEAGDLSQAAQRLAALDLERDDVKALQARMEDRRAVLARERSDFDAAVEAGRLDDAIARVRGVSTGLTDGLAAVFGRLVEKAARSRDPMLQARVFAALRGVSVAAPPEIVSRAAEQLVEAVEKSIRRNPEPTALAPLDVFPLGVSVDAKAAALAKGVRRLWKAREALRLGDRRLAQALAGEALASVPKLAAAIEVLEGADRLEAEARPLLASIRQDLAAGRCAAARTTLVTLLEKQPGHADAKDLLSGLERQQRVDLSELSRAHADLAAGRLDSARELLVGLSFRRPDLQDVPSLLEDLERRHREEKLREADAESRLFPSPSHAEGSTMGPPIGLARRASPPSTPSPFGAGLPFILRVEERGDWLAIPKDVVTVGNSRSGDVDLPLFAALGGQHARWKRVRTDDAVHYVLESAPGRRVLRNRRVLGPEEVRLEHGDRIDLGGIVSCVFLRPVEANETAVLEFDPEFPVHGCTRVLLFSERGASGAIVIGPGPAAHIPLPPDRDRIELLREPEAGGRLLARCPFGIGVADGPQRPQVVVSQPLRLHTMDVDLFVDPLS